MQLQFYNEYMSSINNGQKVSYRKFPHNKKKQTKQDLVSL